MLNSVFGRLTSATLVGLFCLALSTSPLFAQETETYCVQLDEADCMLLSTAATAMQDVQSMESVSTVMLNLVDIPSLPFDEFGINYAQYSAYSIEPEAMALFKEMQEMSAGELEMMMSNPVDLVNFVELILTSMDLSLEMDLELSDGILALINEEFRAETGMDLPAELGLQLRFIDGIVYVDMTTIAEMVPEVGAFVQGWVGVDSAPLLQMARDEMAAAGIDEDFSLDSSSELDDNPFAAMSMNQSGPLITAVDSIDPTGESSNYLAIERLEEEGEGIASFRTTLDYDVFMKSEAFRGLVYAIMTENGANVTAEELDETVTLAQIMAPAFLEDLQLELIEDIAQDTGYLLGGDLLLDWDLKSILTLAGQSDPSLQLEDGDNPNLTFGSSSSNSSINEEVTVEVPEGAFVVPTEMLMMLMNS